MNQTPTVSTIRFSNKENSRICKGIHSFRGSFKVPLTNLPDFLNDSPKNDCQLKTTALVLKKCFRRRNGKKNVTSYQKTRVRFCSKIANSADEGSDQIQKALAQLTQENSYPKTGLGKI
jgi:hypothetical protein